MGKGGGVLRWSKQQPSKGKRGGARTLEEGKGDEVGGFVQMKRFRGGRGERDRQRNRHCVPVHVDVFREAAD